jgi:predicted Zn-dependent protease
MITEELWPRRRVVILLTLAGVVVMFVFTSLLVARYRAEERRLGREWYRRGEAALAAKQPDRAIDAFRNALAYSRENTEYRLRLAESLSAAGRVDEAHAYLVRLWEEQPGNGRVALALARVAVQRGEITDAERYYHAAIYGAWDSAADARQRQVRLELANVELRRGATQVAEADLVALAGQLPDSSPLHTEVGTLLLRVGSVPRALREFTRALSLNPDDAHAAAGAAEANFELGDYDAARQLARRAEAAGIADQHVREIADVSALVLESDPFARRLTAAARRARVIRAFEAASARVASCRSSRVSAAGDLADTDARLEASRPRVTAAGLRRDPDLLQEVMDEVFAAEDAAERACGAATGVDRALVLIGARDRRGTS